MDLPFGSRLLTAWADTIISIEKPSRSTRKLDMASNYGEIDIITYTKDFQVVGEVVDETKLEAAMTIIEEQWKQFRHPNISQKVTDVAETLGCSYTTAWAAYREVKQRMKATGEQDGQVTTDEADGDLNESQTH